MTGVQTCALPIYDSARRVWPHARETSAQEWRVALNVAAWFVLFLVLVFAGVKYRAALKWRNAEMRGAAIRAAAFGIFCYAIGPGLIVNAGFKNNWGRARPNTVAEFNGGRLYTPPLQPTDQCGRNCSFVSGEGSLGFVSAAPSVLLEGGGRLLMLGGGIALGIALGGVRILQGAHFLSDVIFSGLASWFAIWLAYGLVYRAWVWGPWLARRRAAAKAAV